MKSIENFKRTASELQEKSLQNIKGGSNQLVIVAQIDICTTGPNGQTTTLYCDRRRRVIG